MVKGWESWNRNIWRHVYECHLPVELQVRYITSKNFADWRRADLKNLTRQLLNTDSITSLYKAVVDKNVMHKEAEVVSSDTPWLHQICEAEGQEQVECFTHHPINSLALLYHWRV